MTPCRAYAPITAVVGANDADLSIGLLGDNGTDKAPPLCRTRGSRRRISPALSAVIAPSPPIRHHFGSTDTSRPIRALHHFSSRPGKDSFSNPPTVYIYYGKHHRSTCRKRTAHSLMRATLRPAHRSRKPSASRRGHRSPKGTPCRIPPQTMADDPPFSPVGTRPSRMVHATLLPRLRVLGRHVRQNQRQIIGTRHTVCAQPPPAAGCLPCSKACAWPSADTPDNAEGPAMGRLHAYTDVYGVDSMHPPPQLALHDMRPRKGQPSTIRGHVRKMLACYPRRVLARRLSPTSVHSSALGQNTRHHRAATAV